ncbi:hypothetical protein PENTCL1PPCAC_17214, partial [Pristionchus entomophagus]
LEFTRFLSNVRRVITTYELHLPYIHQDDTYIATLLRRIPYLSLPEPPSNGDYYDYASLSSHLQNEVPSTVSSMTDAPSASNPTDEDARVVSTATLEEQRVTNRLSFISRAMRNASQAASSLMSKIGNLASRPDIETVPGRKCCRAN